MTIRQTTFRPAVYGDITDIVVLLRRSWLTTWAPELPFTAVQHFARSDPAADYGATMWARFQIAVRGERLLAMVHVEDDRIAAIHVDPTAKSQGIGTQLMDWAEDHIAREHPVARLEVRSFNIAARDFYRRRGWTEAQRYVDSECGSPVETFELHKSVADRTGPTKVLKA